ncbi:hypothetical protein RB2150_00779 [Rhodobacterales bacterium HTCC2150]|nr:hypothetical protein RB2150_00779 [Rhodobacterales bacterium HTCC2150] [Rhodobacteraceae bacterium HTCC2150]
MNEKRAILIGLCILVLSGCASLPNFDRKSREVALVPSDPEIYKLRPMPRVGAGATVVPVDATSVEDFDTTTLSERNAAASVPVASAEQKLGITIASLGSPTETGFWAKTPLVTQNAKGHLVDPATGKSVQVDLIPIDGPKTAGSRVSLAAMRLLGVSLTGLPELEVWIDG